MMKRSSRALINYKYNKHWDTKKRLKVMATLLVT